MVEDLVCASTSDSHGLGRVALALRVACQSSRLGIVWWRETLNCKWFVLYTSTRLPSRARCCKSEVVGLSGMSRVRENTIQAAGVSYMIDWMVSRFLMVVGLAELIVKRI